MKHNRQLDRIYKILESGDFDAAYDGAARYLENEPNSAEAYIAMLLSMLEWTDIEQLAQSDVSLTNYKEYQAALDCADEEFKLELETLEKRVQQALHKNGHGTRAKNNSNTNSIEQTKEHAIPSEPKSNNVTIPIVNNDIDGGSSFSSSRCGYSGSSRSYSQPFTAVLAFFLGMVGAHRYYLGYYLSGFMQTLGGILLAIVLPMTFSERIVSAGEFNLLMALLAPGAVTAFSAFIDFIRILTGSLGPADGSEYGQVAQVISSTSPSSDNADALAKMAMLHKQGVLTDEEFVSQKAKILERM